MSIIFLIAMIMAVIYLESKYNSKQNIALCGHQTNEVNNKFKRNGNG
jgi:hypothetical protein